MVLFLHLSRLKDGQIHKLGNQKGLLSPITFEYQLLKRIPEQNHASFSLRVWQLVQLIIYVKALNMQHLPGFALHYMLFLHNILQDL